MALASANCLTWQSRKLVSFFLPLHDESKFRNPVSMCFPDSFSHRRNRVSAISCSSGTAVSDVDRVQNSIPPLGNSWSEFAGNVSGEWDGFGAEFTNEGKPIELPESVVPEAFREWEVKVFDWQTQCPTLAQPDNPTMMYKSIKLLPTVGCEADAATRHSIDERNIGCTDDDKVSAFGFHSNGSYVTVWRLGDRMLEVEHCLVNPKNKESRVRIYQVIKVDGTKMVLQSIRVFCEQWYGPFRNGDQLGGCAIRDSGFASTPAINASEVAGVWQGHASVWSDCSNTSCVQEIKDERVTKCSREESNLILLPRKLWSSISEAGNGEMYSEVGWVIEEGNAVTSRCIFSNDNKPKEITITQETAVL